MYSCMIWIRNVFVPKVSNYTKSFMLDLHMKLDAFQMIHQNLYQLTGYLTLNEIATLDHLANKR